MISKSDPLYVIGSAGIYTPHSTREPVDDVQAEINRVVEARSKRLEQLYGHQ